VTVGGGGGGGSSVDGGGTVGASDVVVAGDVVGVVVGDAVTAGAVVPVLELVVVPDEPPYKPYEPLYWYWPRQLVQTGCVVARGNGTSARLPIAVSM
jgi:hypothetical protein